MPETVWNDGDVATAALLNQIEDQLVVTCTSATRPAGIEGRVIYETDLNVLRVYHGSGWTIVAGSAWVSFTPSWTNVTVGTGATNTGRYMYVQGSIRVQARLVLGAGGAVTGAVTMTMPNGETAGVAPFSLGSAVAFQGGATVEWPGVCRSLASGSTLRFYSPTGNDWNTNNPFTWGNTDQMWADIMVAL
jgi:hypothetical protein